MQLLCLKGVVLRWWILLTSLPVNVEFQKKFWTWFDKTFLFKVELSSGVNTRFEQSYRVKKLCADEAVIQKFISKFPSLDVVVQEGPSGESVAQDVMPKFVDVVVHTQPQYTDPKIDVVGTDSVALNPADIDVVGFIIHGHLKVSYKENKGFIGCTQWYDYWYGSQEPNPNVFVGALVGGPDGQDNFEDKRSNFMQTEACTYNRPLLKTPPHLLVGKAQKKDTAPIGYHQRRPTKESKNKYPSAESFTEKELSVDKLEITRTQPQPQPPPHEEGNKRKILERLDSDAQKLMNLEITVQDLINKMEIIEKSTKGQGIEYDTVKGQLEAAQETITKLFDTNRKLMKNVEDGTSSFAGKSITASDESGSVSRRRVSEQARRGSEKIGRLQLEVQRLQFLLVKLNDDKEGKGKAMVDDQNPRVLLRDYLYDGTRKNYHKIRKKKASFCACMQPPTKG